MTTIADKEFVRRLLPKRTRVSHKGTYGRAAIVGGSMTYTGAAYLSAAACLRSGAGYTALFLPREILPYYVLRLPEVLLECVCDGGRYAFNEENMQKLLAYDAVAYGMGMGVSEEVCRGAAWLLSLYEGKLVLDADALNSLAKYAADIRALFRASRADVMITPHVKEFSRLTGCTVEKIAAALSDSATAWAAENGATVVLKSYYTAISDGAKSYLSETGNSGQAKGGSGDVLSGVLVGLCAMGAPTLSAGICGAYLTGKAAEIAVRKTGEYALTASDVIASLGSAFLFVTEHAREERDDEQDETE